MEQEKKENIWAGAYEILCRGRVPFAKVEMRGNESHPSVFGTVDFYSTPVGVLVHAHVCGLPCKEKSQNRARAYRFCLYGQKEACASREEFVIPTKDHLLCNVLPTVYEKDGTLWCSVLTGRILPVDLFGKVMSIYESGNSPTSRESVGEVASGMVECACIKKIHA